MTEPTPQEPNPGATTPPAEANPAPTPPPALAEPTVDASGRSHDPQNGRFVPADRFDAEVGKKWEAIRKAERLEQELEMLRGAANAAHTPQEPANPTGNAPNAPSEAEIERRVRERAAQERFNERCNESAAQGKAAHSDFMEKIEALARISPFSIPDARGVPVPAIPPALLEAALDTGKGHEVLYELGCNPTEADRIMGLSPTRQAIELARMADKLGSDTTVTTPAAPAAPAAPNAPVDPATVRAAISAAPPPVPAVVGGASLNSGQFNAYDTQTNDTASWIKARQAEVDAKRKAGRGW